MSQTIIFLFRLIVGLSRRWERFFYQKIYGCALFFFCLCLGGTLFIFLPFFGCSVFSFQYSVWSCGGLYFCL